MGAIVSLGLDFGTESVRAVLIDCKGCQLAVASREYQYGQITETLPESDIALPPHYALQSPQDWIDAAADATTQALRKAGISGGQVVGIGVDFTSCTMLSTTCQGKPLCQLPEFSQMPLAWPKLWKHHAAGPQTDLMNEVAQQRNETFLKRYGGTIGLEWFFPKMLETIQNAPDVADAADVWLEAGDWFVWQLVGGEAKTLTRSSCQAGYKAMWSAADGYPSQDYFSAVDPLLAKAVSTKLPGVYRAPGESAGRLQPSMAQRFGLDAGTPVSTAIIDAHAAVPGVGAAEPGTLVMVMGTSSCHMLNANHFADIAGVAGVVEGGILPGMFGYETGQAAVGDAFAWLLKLLNLNSFDQLARDAMKLPPGADGVACLDWMNGCRTPLMDGSVRGAFTGLAMHHGPEHLYRALMEASAFGLRWIVELLREGGLIVERFIATGGLPHHNRSFVEVYADVLGVDIEIHPSTQAPAVGAAVLGMLAAGEAVTHFQNVTQAARAMAGADSDELIVVRPRADRKSSYDHLYAGYRAMATQHSQGG